ncbi:MAG: PadR family transcriptional regulator [Actinomycetota bacterium]
MGLSPTAYVILGLLRTTPKSGYEIKAIVDNSTRFFWAASYGQIYPELKRLAEEGLVEGSEAPRGGRKRIVYKITRRGKQELRAWLRRPPTTFELRDEGLLKLFFADALAPEEAVEILRAMREYRRGAVERLREIEPKAMAAGGYPLIVLRGGIEYNEQLADWCEKVERQILDETGEERIA